MFIIRASLPARDELNRAAQRRKKSAALSGMARVKLKLGLQPARGKMRA